MPPQSHGPTPSCLSASPQTLPSLNFQTWRTHRELNGGVHGMPKRRIAACSGCVTDSNDAPSNGQPESPYPPVVELPPADAARYGPWSRDVGRDPKSASPTDGRVRSLSPTGAPESRECARTMVLRQGGTFDGCACTHHWCLHVDKALTEPGVLRTGEGRVENGFRFWFCRRHPRSHPSNRRPFTMDPGGAVRHHA